MHDFITKTLDEMVEMTFNKIPKLTRIPKKEAAVFSKKITRKKKKPVFEHY